VVTVSLVKLFSYFRFKKVKNKFGTLIKVDFYSSFRLQKWESKNDYSIVTREKVQIAKIALRFNWTLKNNETLTKIIRFDLGLFPQQNISVESHICMPR